MTDSAASEFRPEQVDRITDAFAETWEATDAVQDGTGDPHDFERARSVLRRAQANASPEELEASRLRIFGHRHP